MSVRSHFLGGGNQPPPPAKASSRGSRLIKPPFSDIIVYFSMLCVIFCIMTYVMIAFCPWFRRVMGRPTAVPAFTNKGLKEKFLKTLPTLIYRSDNQQDKNLSDCPICLAEFANGEEVCILPRGGHGFHVKCIDNWLRSHSTCPSCRQILVVTTWQKRRSLPSAVDTSSFARIADGAQPRHV